MLFVGWAILIICLFDKYETKPIEQNSDSPLRSFFRRIDLNSNEELDTRELQYYFHDIEPENPLPELDAVAYAMTRTKKNSFKENEKDFRLTWTQFRQDYIELDRFTELGGPQQIHLSLLSDGSWSTVIVIWIVKGAVFEHEPTSKVEYGKISGNYTYEQLASNRTYHVGIGGWDGTIFEAWMTNLEPCQTYYYRVGNKNFHSKEISFKTDCPSTTTRVFAIMGDMGTVIPAGYLVAKQIADDHKVTPFSAVIHAGDISYAGTGSQDELAEVWDMWGRQVEPISSLVPYMTSVGNHEAYYNYTAYRNRFRMPGPESAGVDNFWFSFNTGPIHWVSVSTQHDYSKNSPQYAWLINDLAESLKNRQQQPFVIIVTHRPLLCSDVSEQDQHWPNSPLFQTLYPVFVEYQVQLVLTGHMHVYERVFYDNTTVVHNDTYVNQQSPVVIVQGTGGSFDNDKWIDPKPWWSVSRALAYGYGRLTVIVDDTQRRLDYEFLLEHDKSTYDRFSIIV